MMRGAFGKEDGNYVGAEEDYRKWRRRYENVQTDSSISSHDKLEFLEESPRWMVHRMGQEFQSTRARPVAVPGGVYRTGYTFGSALLLGSLFLADPRSWEFYSGIFSGLSILFTSSIISFGVSHGYWPQDRYDFWEVLWTSLMYPVGLACFAGLLILYLGGCN